MKRDINIPPFPFLFLVCFDLIDVLMCKGHSEKLKVPPSSSVLTLIVCCDPTSDFVTILKCNILSYCYRSWVPKAGWILVVVLLHECCAACSGVRVCVCVWVFPHRCSQNCAVLWRPISALNPCCHASAPAFTPIEAKNTVNIYLCLFRLPQFTTDILVTFNDPVCIDPLSSSAAGFVAAVPWTLQDFQNVLQSFRLLNPGVFG